MKNETKNEVLCKSFLNDLLDNLSTVKDIKEVEKLLNLEVDVNEYEKKLKEKEKSLNSQK